MSKVGDLFLEAARGSQRNKVYSMAPKKPHFTPNQLFHKYMSFVTGEGWLKNVNHLTQIHAHYGGKNVSWFRYHPVSIFIQGVGRRCPGDQGKIWTWVLPREGFLPFVEVCLGPAIQHGTRSKLGRSPVIRPTNHAGLSSSESFPFSSYGSHSSATEHKVTRCRERRRNKEQ